MRKLVGAVGIEFAANSIKSYSVKALAAFTKTNWCQLEPNGYLEGFSETGQPSLRFAASIHFQSKCIF
jgi:hypothetical protein